ncbi:AI-2E family transporter [Pantanalinema rosaneae CENA516]|uniref:AI-2E family transporter n=1 Tax=Pantanalinema rosaneae TaxID=1620701 RepID=UPI003D6FEAEB
MRLGQWLGLLAIVAAVYVIWQIRQLMLLIFTAIVLATAINQLVRLLQNTGMKRTPAALLSVGIVLSLLLSVIWLIVPPFIAQFQDLIALFPIGLERIEQGINWLRERSGEWLPEFPGIDVLLQQLQVQRMNLLQRAFAFFSNSISAVLELLLVLVLTLMLLINPKPYRQTFVRCFPGFYRRRANQILSRCAEGLGNWTIGALIEMVFIGALSGIGLWILQVPLVLAHAVLAGLLNFIPNIGPTLSVVIPMSIALLDAPWKAIAVLILYIAIQNVESYWLTPTIMAKQVALLPAITLVSQIFFASFFGPLGLVMAIPLTVVVKTWITESVFKDILDQWRQTPPWRTRKPRIITISRSK